MATSFPDPPTYADPITKDETTGKEVFNPIWIQWFLDMAKVFSVLGVGSGSTVSHNNLSGLQGGTTGEYFHLKTIPIAAGASATRVDGAGITVKIDTTYAGYTLAQVVAALETAGILT